MARKGGRRRAAAKGLLAACLALGLGAAAMLFAQQGAPAPAGAGERIEAGGVAGAARAAEVTPEGRSTAPAPVEGVPAGHEGGHAAPPQVDYWSLLFVFVPATFIGLGVIARVSRLLHTPLMSLTNAISAIAVVGAILVAGPDYPAGIRLLGAVALFASMTNIVSGFLITDRMLKMFKQSRGEDKR